MMRMTVCDDDYEFMIIMISNHFVIIFLLTVFLLSVKNDRECYYIDIFIS